ncbi:MAG: hypothetical protein ACMG6E_10865, partial [Candidatus Roizmanbacteria bacterium]
LLVLLLLILLYLNHHMVVEPFILIRIVGATVTALILFLFIAFITCFQLALLACSSHFFIIITLLVFFLSFIGEPLEERRVQSFKVKLFGKRQLWRFGLY